MEEKRQAAIKIHLLSMQELERKMEEQKKKLVSREAACKRLQRESHFIMMAVNYKNN